MDLMAKYLILILIFLSVNIGLLLNCYRDNRKRSVFLAIYTVILLISTTFSINFLKSSNILSQSFNLIIILIPIIILILTYYFENQELNKRNINEIILIVISLSTYILMISIVSLSNTAHENLIYGTDPLINGVLISILSLAIILIINILTKNLKYRVKSYENIVGEYMIVESIFFLMIGLTYNSLKNLDYSIFEPFLILTPTYQVASVVIGLCILIVLGTYVKKL